MTKERTAYTFADATTRVAGRIGWAELCRLTQRSDRAVRAWSDPDSGTGPTIVQALELDIAYRAAGGEDDPFLDAYEFMIGARQDRRDACVRELIEQISATSKEFGEAVAACLALAQTNIAPRQTQRALAETQEVALCIDTLLRRLARFLPHAVCGEKEQG